MSLAQVMMMLGGAASPPTLSALNFTVIDTAGGGQRLVFTVDDSSGCISAEVSGGGPAVTDFQIDDTTHVSGVAPAHAAGAVSWTVTNGGGTSNALSGSKYWDPSLVTGVDTWLDAERGVTQSGTVSAWLDGSSHARNYVQATGALRPAYTANAFGSLHGLTFGASHSLRNATPSALVGMSVFVVAKWTSSDATPSRSDTVALAAVGDIVNATMGFGAAAGNVQSVKLNTGGSPVRSTSTGQSLNNGNPQHIGAVTASATTKLYSAGSLVATDSTGGGIWAGTSYDTIGNTYTASDFFDGTIGEIVVVSGAISAGDLADLYQHARQRWGVA